MNKIRALKYKMDDEKQLCTLYIIRDLNTNKYVEPFNSIRLQRLSRVLEEMNEQDKLLFDWEHPNGSIIRGDWTWFIYYS